MRKLFILLVLSLTACSIIATRPIQEMANTSAAIRAAKEVQADVLAPELFQQANEIFFKAKQDYRFKDFSSARTFAEKARKFAEQAEYEAIRSGGARADAPVDPLAKEGMVSKGEDQTAVPEPTPYPYPSPESIAADVYDERMKEQQQNQQQQNSASPSSPPGLAPGHPGLPPSLGGK